MKARHVHKNIKVAKIEFSNLDITPTFLPMYSNEIASGETCESVVIPGMVSSFEPNCGKLNQ
jgi:hypothetical protein